MLVAYGPDGQPLVADEAPLEQLQTWSRDHMLHCPNCKKNVHIRGGHEKRTQLHFAHQRGECEWSTEAESVRHASGKLVLAHWLRAQFPQSQVTLEERLPEPNRIADVFLRHPDGQQWALEFQCAPLAIEEWQHRHTAYRTAGIIDTWIIGNNRREKQEAFIEAILAEAREIVFLDPLVHPPRTWLRWPLTRHQVQQWQETQTGHAARHTPQLDGWVGRMGYGMTLTGALHDLHMDEQANLVHPVRTTLAAQTQILRTLTTASQLDAAQLSAYLRPIVGEEALRVVLIPLLRAYMHDPDLLRRYNYGRGLPDQPISEADRQRIQKARAWLNGLILHGFTTARLQLLIKEIPFVGPYAAFASYAEMLLTLNRI
ncbi:MAG TPA: competence protein CoiA family protein [Ktedonobacteraceae bacterium]|nr:competence protein CoiA family protein [Ktedonobacteraceae bacterium]